MEHSRRWWLHIWGSKMFEPLFHAGMSVFDQFFCRIYMSTDWRKVRNQKLVHRSGKYTQKTKFSKKFFKRANLKLGIPEMCHQKSRYPEIGQPNLEIPNMCYHKLRIPEMCQLKSCSAFQEFLIWAATFREFSICGSTFQEFLIWGWHISGILDLRWHISGIPDLRLALFKKFLENCVFLVCFPLQWISFWLLTLLQSVDMYILQKELVKNANSCLK